MEFNRRTFPTGTTSGNQNTGIPFDVATFNGIAGKLESSGCRRRPETSFYALLNNIYGTAGADEYNNGVTYESIGDVNTRDYNSNVFTNTIADTTFPWFNNGIGQRLDVREFNLPVSFKSEVILDFIITHVDVTDSALFSGLTFSNVPCPSPTPAPEASSILLIGTGGGALWLFMLSRNRRAGPCPAARAMSSDESSRESTMKTRLDWR